MPDNGLTTSDFELRAQVDRALSANYELEEEIGRGGMGIVYRARDKRLKRSVAVKLLPPELAFRSDIRSRFLREAETAAQLNHPHIVPIYSVGEEGSLVFFIMAYVSGDNLAKRIHDVGPMDHEDVRRILREVADALSYAHGRNVIHRDIKPDNILLDAETGRAMVTDFGIARAVIEGSGSRLTATGMALGTPAYMSPEQAAGDRDIDGRSDIYALGVVAYQMLCGSLPFDAPNTPAMLVKHLSEIPRPINDRCDGLPEDLSRAVMLMLEKSPDGRFPSAAALAAALQTGDVPYPQGTSWSPMDGSTTFGRTDTYRSDPRSAQYPVQTAHSDADMDRWEATPVRKFRKSLIPFIAVNSVFLVMSIFTGVDLFFVTMFWGVGIAMGYSKLWSKGYDWRDVFRQPRDRLFVDVAGETLDDARAIFDPKKRAEVREKMRNRSQRPPLLRSMGTTPVPGGRSMTGTNQAARRVTPDAAPDANESPMVRKARGDRDEIRRLVRSMPKDDRDLIPDVVVSADSLFDRVQSLDRSVVSLDRQNVGSAAKDLEREVLDLESKANPLEAGSEQRVRRLAMLKRQRRVLLDVKRRRDDAASKMESCRMALENMRLDVLRLRTGGQSHQNVTLLAEQAMRLAADIDVFVYAANETGRLSATR